MRTEIKKGIFNESKTIICKTDATKNNLKEEPITLDNKKKKEPVLYENTPNLSFKYE